MTERYSGTPRRENIVGREMKNSKGDFVTGLRDYPLSLALSHNGARGLTGNFSSLSCTFCFIHQFRELSTCGCDLRKYFGLRASRVLS